MTAEEKAQEYGQMVAEVAGIIDQGNGVLPCVSGGWFDFYGSKNENRNIVYPKIDENVEFETTNGLTIKGEFANKHSVGVFWAKSWGYFYDEQVVRWRSPNDH